eukprot:12257976-Prorocentrum_lima.AAC.1
MPRQPMENLAMAEETETAIAALLPSSVLVGTVPAIAALLPAVSSVSGKEGKNPLLQLRRSLL